MHTSANAGRWQALKDRFRRNLSFITSHRLLEIVITCGLILAVGAPRWLASNRFVTADEGLWLKYSGWFYYALSNRDFATTFQVSHPGVTVMWAGVISFVEEYPDYRDKIEGQDRPIGLNTLARGDYTLPLRILTVGRRVMVLLHVIALWLSYMFARRLFGTVPALAGLLLIAFDPFDIALSKVLQPDGLLAHLMLLSLLAFLAYLNDQKLTPLLVSAVAAGLAWLTKSPGLFLLPLAGLLMLFDLLRSGDNWSKAKLWKSALRTTRVLAIWGMVGALVFYLLWPAMWIDPIGSVVRLLGGAIGYAETGHEWAVFFNGNIYANGDIPGISFYPISFLWRTTPVTLLGLLAVATLFIQKMSAFHRSGNGRISFPINQTGESRFYQDSNSHIWNLAILVLSAAGFIALMSMGLKKFDRYIIPSIVIMDFVAGVGLVWLVAWMEKLVRGKWLGILPAGFLAGVVIVQAMLAWTVFPYFFSYYNPLLGGSQRAVEVMQIGWGEGLDQAARYINEKPDPEQLRVMAWYGNGPFSYYSKSRVSPLDIDHLWSTADWDQFNKSDYAVVYIHEWQRNLPAEVLDRLRNLKPEYSVWIDGLEYVRIYKIQ